jgi:hypothetical protein
VNLVGSTTRPGPVQVELVSRSQKAQSSVEKEAEVRNCHFLQAETARRKAASWEAAAYVSQGQVPIHRDRPWILAS